VLQVISNNGLLSEVKGTSIGYLFSEMAGKLEAVKKLNEETYEKLKGERNALPVCIAFLKLSNNRSV